MIRPKQFRISTLLFTTVLAAVVIQFGHLWQVLLIIIEISAVLVGTEILLGQLPENVKRASERNCLRFDGSRSDQREATERRATKKLRSNVRFLLTLVLLPWNLMYWHDQFETWQLIAMSLLGLTLCCVMIRHGYVQFLNDYIFGIKRRAQDYTIRDLKLIDAPNARTNQVRNSIPVTDANRSMA